jgi:hypothetical protein
MQDLETWKRSRSRHSGGAASSLFERSDGPQDVETIGPAKPELGTLGRVGVSDDRRNRRPATVGQSNQNHARNSARIHLDDLSASALMNSLVVHDDVAARILVAPR